jgi:hypothetical protein
MLSARLHPPLRVSVRSKFLLDTSDIYNAIYSKENLFKMFKRFSGVGTPNLVTSFNRDFFSKFPTYDTVRWDDAICLAFALLVV